MSEQPNDSKLLSLLKDIKAHPDYRINYPFLYQATPKSELYLDFESIHESVQMLSVLGAIGLISEVPSSQGIYRGVCYKIVVNKTQFEKLALELSLEKLHSTSVEVPTIDLDIKISFDPIKSEIIVNSTPVKILKGRIQHDLCKALFSKPHQWKDLQYLSKKLGNREKVTDNKQVYDACKNLNAKIFNKTAIFNLVVNNNNSWRLNPDYIYL